MARNETAHITPADIYRALSPKLAQRLHDHCKVAKEHPADVLAGALVLHFDELDGEAPDLIEPAPAGGQLS